MDYFLVLSPDELADTRDHYLSVDSFAFDVETMGDHALDPSRNIISWLSLSSGDRTDVIPMGHPNGDLDRVEYPLLKSGRDRQAAGKPLRSTDFSVDENKARFIFTAPPEQLYRSEVFRVLSDIFQSQALKIAHNAKFDINSIYKHTAVRGPFWDTQVADWVVDSSRTGSLGLADCVKRHLGIAMSKHVGKDILRHPFYEVADYSALDAFLTYRLFTCQEPLVSGGPLDRVFRLEMDVLGVLAGMERTGVTLDQGALKELSDHLEHRIDVALESAYLTAGRKFNVNSPREKQEVLFQPRSVGGQGLVPRELTPSGKKHLEEGEELKLGDYSTSSSALSWHAKNPLVRCLSEYSSMSKLITTYIRPYLGGSTERRRGKKVVVESVDSRLVGGRLHTYFSQTSAETGRLSSRQPNLQNVPARSEEGKRIRDLFVASEGYVLVQADYSQIEPRIISDLSGDSLLRDTYMSGGDVYQVVADRLGVGRHVGKTLVLAIAYGVGPNKIANDVGISITKARELMDFFNEQFPKIITHKMRVVNRAKRNKPHFSETILGRRRYLPMLSSASQVDRGRAERQAYNHLIQGSAADLMKIALVDIQNAVSDEVRMLLTVHDEVVLEAPEDMGKEVASILKSAMESAGEGVLSVPLVAETKVAQTWGECK